MSILAAQHIRELCIYGPYGETQPKPLIDPFHIRTEHNGMSFGLSSAGYDIRVAEDHLLKPGQFQLASAIERFQMPNDLLAIVHDKSSWARKGLTVQNTVIEPGWQGFLTLELTNHHNTDWIQLKKGDPIAQIVFHRLSGPTEQPYEGKYQNQEAGPQNARSSKG